MQQNTYLETFIGALLERSTDKQQFDVACSEWVVAGGDSGRSENLLMSQGKFTWGYYVKHFSHKFKAPPKSDRCMCGHHIEQNCYIFNVKTKEYAIVGNCCVKKFMDKSGKSCELCLREHRRRKENLCLLCAKYKDYRFISGKYTGKSYIDVFRTDSGYFEWMHKSGFVEKSTKLGIFLDIINKRFSQNAETDTQCTPSPNDNSQS
jgi:hypothetical protein